MDSHNAAVAANIKTVLAFKPFLLQYFKPRILIRIMAYLTHYVYQKKIQNQILNQYDNKSSTSKDEQTTK